MAPNRRLKQARELRGWSQARLAEMIGTDATTVSRWERGLFVPTPHFREKLCQCFGKNAEELGLLDAMVETDPHSHGVLGLPRDTDIYGGSGLAGSASLSGRGEMVALKPRITPDGTDTFTYILQRSSQEQQAYMLWEHAYVQALQDQPAEAQRLGQASVSVFEQVRHPNAAVVRAWLSQQGLLSVANSADSARSSEITRKRASSSTWLRVGGASVFVMLVFVAGMMLSGVTPNHTRLPASSDIKYSHVPEGNGTSGTPTSHTSSVIPKHSNPTPGVGKGHAIQTPSVVPTPLPTHSPVPSPTSTAIANNGSFNPNVHYKLINRKSGKALDVYDKSTTSGANVVQWSYSGSTNQQWNIIAVGSYYKLVSVNSGQVLDVSVASIFDGAQVDQWPDSGTPNQQWDIVIVGNYYELINHKSGKVLDVNQASISNGTNVIQWTNNDALNQQWSIVLA